jgi:hypothetical protein
MDEQNETMPEEETGAKKVRTFIQENLRVITSVFIVAVIAIGIYSYSDRSVPTDETDLAGEVTSSETEKIAEEDGMDSEGMIGDGMENESEEIATEAIKETEMTETATTHPVETSRETESAFVESAERGDGLTHLARRATTHYLEKNADSSLTAEHRIYIEDYLRKHVGHEGHVSVGTSVEFSKDLIREAIDASKQLDARQLENLKQYSARVSAFR